MPRSVSIYLGLLLLAVGAVYAIGMGWLGSHWGAGTPTPLRIPPEVVAQRDRGRTRAAAPAGAHTQILFGDLHVHSTYSTDAFLMSLPLAGGDGARPVSDACDFARFCSALDFWSINDHATALTPRRWSETVQAIRQCNAVSGEEQDPDVSAFLGWEWTQIGTTPNDHYGHKNVVLRDLEDDAIPTRPIAADSPATRSAALPSVWGLGLAPIAAADASLFDLATYLQELTAVPRCAKGVPVRELPVGCREAVETPGELFAKLDEWGFESLVIPHGTTWGFYTPQGSDWRKQLSEAQHDPRRQRLVEVYSGHGNSEEYRSFRSVEVGADGAARCPEPTAGYLPSCWQAGEIIRARCRDAGESEAECDARAAEARQHYADAPVWSRLTVPADAPDDWLDAGQCRDCFQPAFNYRPLGSVHYLLALRSFDGPGRPLSFRFGFLASSDNHSARPGTGYKEYARTEMTEARFSSFASSVLGGGASGEPEPRSRPLPPDAGRRVGFFSRMETERQASFFVTGGLVAVHAKARSRDAIWKALRARRVYGTSGPRILLWFDLLNAPRVGRLGMGGETRMRATPVFEVRAVGSFEQQPGCPEFAEQSLSPANLERLCRGECYHPSDRRRAIVRIEMVRIRPQRRADEPVEPLIEDPWRVFECPPDPAGCTATFLDEEFTSARRDTLYYVRAIEAESLAVNANGLRCRRDADGACLEVKPCRDADAGDDCLAETQQRAWSSPIYVDFAASRGRRR